MVEEEGDRHEMIEGRVEGEERDLRNELTFVEKILVTARAWACWKKSVLAN